MKAILAQNGVYKVGLPVRSSQDFYLQRFNYCPCMIHPLVQVHITCMVKQLSQGLPCVAKTLNVRVICRLIHGARTAVSAVKRKN